MQVCDLFASSLSDFGNRSEKYEKSRAFLPEFRMILNIFDENSDKNESILSISQQIRPKSDRLLEKLIQRGLPSLIATTTYFVNKSYSCAIIDEIGLISVL